MVVDAAVCNDNSTKGLRDLMFAMRGLRQALPERVPCVVYARKPHLDALLAGHSRHFQEFVAMQLLQPLPDDFRSSPKPSPPDIMRDVAKVRAGRGCRTHMLAQIACRHTPHKAVGSCRNHT
jgi:hypothetical protein